VRGADVHGERGFQVGVGQRHGVDGRAQRRVMDDGVEVTTGGFACGTGEGAQ
jgi:hypothetical protein